MKKSKSGYAAVPKASPKKAIRPKAKGGGKRAGQARGYSKKGC